MARLCSSIRKHLARTGHSWLQRPRASALGGFPRERTALQCRSKRSGEAVHGKRWTISGGWMRPRRKPTLRRPSYQDYLLKNVKVTPDLIPYFKPSMHGHNGVESMRFRRATWRVWANCRIRGAWHCGSRRAGNRFGSTRQDDEPYIYHFPDAMLRLRGCSCARLFPESLPESTMEMWSWQNSITQCWTRGRTGAHRLNSTAVHAGNLGDAPIPKASK